MVLVYSYFYYLYFWCHFQKSYQQDQYQEAFTMFCLEILWIWCYGRPFPFSVHFYECCSIGVRFHSSSCGYPVFQPHSLKIYYPFPIDYSYLLCQCDYIFEAFFPNSLFWSIGLCDYFYVNIIIVIMIVLWYRLKSGSVMPSALFFFKRSFGLFKFIVPPYKF